MKTRAFPAVGRHNKTVNSCRALLRRAANSHRVHRIAQEAKEELKRLEAMQPATAQTAAQLAAELREVLDSIPRGTPQTIANRARLRRIWSDPILRAEFLARRAASDEFQRNRPRYRGRWLPSPKPTHSEILRRAHARRKNIGRASAARFADPAFRARTLEQLAAARANIKPRQRDARGHFLPNA